MTLGDLVEIYITEVAPARMGPSALRSYRISLRLLAREHGSAPVTMAALQKTLDRLAIVRSWSPRTAGGALSVLRQALIATHEAGAQIAAGLRTRPIPDPGPQDWPPELACVLLEAAVTWGGPIAGSLVGCSVLAGLRPGETLSILAHPAPWPGSQYEQEQSAIVVTATREMGRRVAQPWPKGRRPGRASVGPQLALLLDAALEERLSVPWRPERRTKPDGSPYLVPYGRERYRALLDLLRARAEALGVRLPRAVLHGGRATAAVELARGGATFGEIQVFLRHKQSGSTEAYLRGHLATIRVDVEGLEERVLSEARHARYGARMAGAAHKQVSNGRYPIQTQQPVRQYSPAGRHIAPSTCVCSHCGAPVSCEAPDDEKGRQP